MAEVDPYHKWLGISPAEQPPNHYRLLGIELFESDPDVIDAGTEQRMTYLQRLATGTHVAESQKLLNEVSAARICLHSPEAKREYDARLRRAMLPAPQPTARSSPSTEKFDGCHEWLGIPKDQRPPTYYQLLCISPDEEHQEAIVAAVERQSRFVEPYVGGDHDEEARMLLFAIQEARATLLDPVRRLSYDTRFNLAHNRNRQHAKAETQPDDDRNPERTRWPFSRTLKKTRLLLALAAAAILVGSLLWLLSPPAQPDPFKLLRAAEDDQEARRFENALAKRVWYHQNVLKYAPSAYGIKSYINLYEWGKLGAVYRPALEALKAIRNDFDQAMRKGTPTREIFYNDFNQPVRKGTATHEIFYDFSSMNRILKEDEKTKDLFMWLDSNKPEMAKSVFNIAESSLVKGKEYRVWNKYIIPDASFQRILYRYRLSYKSSPVSPDKHFQNYIERQFSTDVATLVALLILNELKTDAYRIAAEAAKELDSPMFKQKLELAKTGIVPAP